jgi:hypothetical protein
MVMTLATVKAGSGEYTRAALVGVGAGWWSEPALAAAGVVEPGNCAATLNGRLLLDDLDAAAAPVLSAFGF